MQIFHHADWLKARQLIPNSAAEKVEKLSAKSWQESRESPTKQIGWQLGESDNILIQSLKENAVNKNTLQSTNNWVTDWKSWAPQKGYDESIEKYEPEALNKILEQFYATVRKKDGDD